VLQQSHLNKPNRHNQNICGEWFDTVLPLVGMVEKWMWWVWLGDDDGGMRNCCDDGMNVWWQKMRCEVISCGNEIKLIYNYVAIHTCSDHAVIMIRSNIHHGSLAPAPSIPPCHPPIVNIAVSGQSRYCAWSWYVPTSTTASPRQPGPSTPCHRLSI